MLHISQVRLRVVFNPFGEKQKGCLAHARDSEGKQGEESVLRSLAIRRFRLEIVRSLEGSRICTFLSPMEVKFLVGSAQLQDLKINQPVH